MSALSTSEACQRLGEAPLLADPGRRQSRSLSHEACSAFVALRIATAAWASSLGVPLPSSVVVRGTRVDEALGTRQDADALLDAREMVLAIKGAGFPMAALSEIVHVERKTVYLWVEGKVTPKSESYDRLALIHSVLMPEALGSLRFYHRFWDRTLPDGDTLRAALTASTSKADRVKRAMNALRPAVNKAAITDGERRAYLAMETHSPASLLTLDLEAGG